MKKKTKSEFFAVVAFFCLFAILGPGLLDAKDYKLPGNLHRLLKNDMSFSKREFKEMNDGEVVTKQLDTEVKQEIAVFGIVRINVPGGFFSKNYWKDSMNIETVAAERKGEFSTTPVMGDVQSFHIPSTDLRALAECKPGQCKVKATEELIRDFGQLDNNAPDFESRGNMLFRQAMVKYLQRYLKLGNEALAEYSDKEKPIRIAEEFQDLLRGTPYVHRYAPELHTYLMEFPNSQLFNARDVFFWMKERFGSEAKRPIISLNHAIFYQRPGVYGERIVASKQLYATHYFEASLGLTIMVEDKGAGKPCFYLMHINRSRIDILREIPEFLAKYYFKGTHKLLHKKMAAVKKNMEAAYRETHQVTAKKMNP